VGCLDGACEAGEEGAFFSVKEVEGNGKEPNGDKEALCTLRPKNSNCDATERAQWKGSINTY
jgi:hypothetical protein